MVVVAGWYAYRNYSRATCQNLLTNMKDLLSNTGLYYIEEYRPGKPLLIYLPHSGLKYSRSKSIQWNLDRLRADVGFKLFINDERFTVLAPMQFDNYNGYTGNPNTGHDGEKFLREMVEKYVYDGRVFVTGHSMGGQGTWELCAKCPEIVTAAVVSAGHATSYQETIKIKDQVKIRAYHGTLDRSEESFAEGKQSFINWYKGDLSNWFPLEGFGHGINGYVYNPAQNVPDWLLKQGAIPVPAPEEPIDILTDVTSLKLNSAGELIINGTHKIQTQTV